MTDSLNTPTYLRDERPIGGPQVRARYGNLMNTYTVPYAIRPDKNVVEGFQGAMHEKYMHQGNINHQPPNVIPWQQAGGLSLLNTPYNPASAVFFPAKTCNLGNDAQISVNNAAAQFVDGTVPYQHHANPKPVKENFDLMTYPAKYPTNDQKPKKVSFSQPEFYCPPKAPADLSYQVQTGGATNAWAENNATCWTAGRGLGDNWGATNSPNTPYMGTVCEGPGRPVCINEPLMRQAYNNGSLTENTIGMKKPPVYRENYTVGAPSPDCNGHCFSDEQCKLCYGEGSQCKISGGTPRCMASAKENMTFPKKKYNAMYNTGGGGCGCGG